MFKRIFFSFLIIQLTFKSVGFAIEIKAPQAFLLDFNTGTVLFEKDADVPMVPSSMTKIMTAYLIFDRLKNKDISLTDQFMVSQEAWKKEGSRMFVQVNTMVPVEDLLRGIIVQSGNDACTVMAEALSGTEAAFAEDMTRRAHEMGAKNTHFVNSTGLPDEGHVSTARDLAIMGERTIRDFPEEYAKYYGMTEFKYNEINQQNRNPLLNKNMGADGIKTGRTESGGYGIVGSAKQGDRRLIVVVNGLETEKEREQDALALLSWGFTHFKNYKLFAEGQEISKVDIWSGKAPHLSLSAAQDIEVTIPRSERKNLTLKVIHQNPIQAPVKKGQYVGDLSILLSSKEIKKIPLYASQEVEQAGFFSRLWKSLTYLLWGKHKE